MLINARGQTLVGNACSQQNGTYSESCFVEVAAKWVAKLQIERHVK